jgi:hypothetical protein
MVAMNVDFEDPNHLPTSPYMDDGFLSKEQKQLFNQVLVQTAQREGRKEEERRKERKEEFLKSLR